MYNDEENNEPTYDNIKKTFFENWLNNSIKDVIDKVGNVIIQKDQKNTQTWKNAEKASNFIGKPKKPGKK